MTLLEQWEDEKQLIQGLVAAGRLSAARAAQKLLELEYRIKRRTAIIKRRKDRRAWRRKEVAKLFDITRSVACL